MPFQLTTSDQAAQVLSVVIKRLYAPVLESVIFRNNKLLGLFDRDESRGDQSYRWKVHTAGNTGVERFTEGTAVPAAGAQTYANADLAYEHYRGITQITGHVKAALKSSEAAFFDAIEGEMVRVRDDIQDTITIESLGALRSGIQLAVDAAGTYAGIDRGVTAAWGSQEDAVGGALTKLVMDTMMRELLDAERASKPTLIIASPTQIENYHQTLAGVAAAGLPSATIFLSGDASAPRSIDLGANWEAARFNQVPIASMPDLTNTVWLFLDATKFRWIDHESWVVKPLGATDDSDRFQVSIRGVLACHNPQKQGKLTGVTA